MVFYVKFDWFFYCVVYFCCFGFVFFDGESCCFFGWLWLVIGFNFEYVCICVKGR